MLHGLNGPGIDYPRSLAADDQGIRSRVVVPCTFAWQGDGLDHENGCVRIRDSLYVVSSKESSREG